MSIKIEILTLQLHAYTHWPVSLSCRFLTPLHHPLMTLMTDHFTLMMFIH